jgi:hypothetical protein
MPKDIVVVLEIGKKTKDEALMKQVVTTAVMFQVVDSSPSGWTDVVRATFDPKQRMPRGNQIETNKVGWLGKMDEVTYYSVSPENHYVAETLKIHSR